MIVSNASKFILLIVTAVALTFYYQATELPYTSKLRGYGTLSGLNWYQRRALIKTYQELFTPLEVENYVEVNCYDLSLKKTDNLSLPDQINAINARTQITTELLTFWSEKQQQAYRLPNVSQETLEHLALIQGMLDDKATKSLCPEYFD